MLRKVLFIIGFFFLFAVSTTWAIDPQYQYLYYSRFVDVKCGPCIFKFSLFDEPVGGTELWSEEGIELELEDKHLHYYLGSGESFDGVDFSQKMWVQVEVKSDEEEDYEVLEGREELEMVPYSFYSEDSAYADNAGDADTLDSLDASDFKEADTQLQASIDAEVAARASEDTTLQANIDAEAAARSSADSAEAAARAAADLALEQEISTAQTSVDAEAAARTAADNNLQAGIAAETADRVSVDSAEAAARIATDETLQANIDTHEHDDTYVSRYDNVVFVTSVEGTGNLSSWPDAGGMTGLEAADAICQARADSVQLPGTFKAWLSDSTTSPGQRFVHSTVPYVRVDGVKIADNWDDLIAVGGNIQNTLNLTELGQVVGSEQYVWTATAYPGIKWGPTCSDWTDTPEEEVAMVGDPEKTNRQWTEALTGGAPAQPCSLPQRLYCFQQDLRHTLDDYDADADGIIDHAAFAESADDADTLDGAHASDFEDADAHLQASIDAETAARTSEDTTLQDNIDAEAAARAAADETLQADINAEATTRAAADATLQGNIDAEATARAAADETLQGNINAEATARAAADETLQDNIDTEAATRAAADETLQADIDTHGAMIANRYKNIVFVTSVTGTGDLSSWPDAGGKTGLEAADAVCQALADDAQLPGTFKAWLSDATTSASQRLVHSSVPYVRVDGVQVADSWEDLTDGILDAPLSVTEDGWEFEWNSDPVHTRTSPNGSNAYWPYVPGDCDSWSKACDFDCGYCGPGCMPPCTCDYRSTVGSTLSTVSYWTWSPSGIYPCALEARLYCFQQDGNPFDIYDADADGIIDYASFAESAADTDMLDGVHASDFEDADAQLQASIGAEAAARASEDTTLQGNIDAEAATRAAADGALQQEISTAQSSVDSEAAARIAADNDLQASIDSEAAARIAADSDEAAARTAADETLQTGIDTHKHDDLRLALCELYDRLGEVPPNLATLCPEYAFGKIAFVTSTIHDGDITLSGADDECRARAAQAGLPNADTYLAWISGYSGGYSVSPATRFTLSSVPYYNTHDDKIADNWNDLTDGSLASPLSYDEFGNHIGGYAWTATTPAGYRRTDPYPSACTTQTPPAPPYSWTTNAVESNGWVGTVGSTYWYWTQSYEFPCNNAYRLYCFEQ
jgi:hypothetical protein